VSTAGEIEAALVSMKQERAGGLIVLSDGLFLKHARRIAELARAAPAHDVRETRKE